MTRVKITTVGNSAGIVLPKEVLAKLRAAKGDTLTLTETPNGVEISPFDPDVEYQLNIAEEVMREDREVLRRLAG
jgi:putative addiction module antidote